MNTQIQTLLEGLSKTLSDAGLSESACKEKVHAFESGLRDATAVAWVGEVNKDDEGDTEGDVWSVSALFTDDSCQLVGDTVHLRLTGGYQMRLCIDGVEDYFTFRDGSGRITTRAFKTRDNAVSWVKEHARWLKPHVK